MIYIFTSCALNYTPKSRALLHSLRKYAPEVKVCLALADKVGIFEDELLSEFDYVFPLAGISEINTPSWIFKHQIVELATAIKPFVLRQILDRDDCEAVFYFDPDMVVFSDIKEMLDDIKKNDILLTPHLTDPEKTIRGIEDNELSALRHGTYNLGYIGVRNCKEGKRFANWWCDRLKSYCREDIPAGIFTDQKWIDLVPGFFENVKILRHPGYNVASWNMSNRKITKDAQDKYMVNGRPLVFYHFTGFDSGAHDVMSDIYSEGCLVVKELIRGYKKKTKKLSEDNVAKIQWAFLNYNDGAVISPMERKVYRLRSDLQSAFPDPFCTSVEDAPIFKQWWDTVGKQEFETEDKVKNKLLIDDNFRQGVVIQSFHVFVRNFHGLYSFIISSSYRKSIIYLFRNTYRAWGIRGILGLIFNK